MNKLTAILVIIIGLILSLDALDVYSVPQADTIIGLAALVIGVLGLIKVFKK